MTLLFRLSRLTASCVAGKLAQVCGVNTWPVPRFSASSVNGTFGDAEHIVRRFACSSLSAHNSSNVPAIASRVLLCWKHKGMFSRSH